jgi:hypothetical protein
MRGEELESALSVRNLALLGRILAVAALNRTVPTSIHSAVRSMSSTRQP